MSGPKSLIQSAKFNNRGKGNFALVLTTSLGYLNEYTVTPETLKMMRSYMTKEQALRYLRNRLVRETVAQFENDLTQHLDRQLRNENEAKTQRDLQE